MLPEPHLVNSFLLMEARFPQYLFALFLMCYSRVRMNRLWIKRYWKLLFLRYLAQVRRLVIRPGAIGDFILSLPALECLKADTLEIWAASQNLPLVRFADRVRSIASTGLDLLGVTEPPPRLVEELRGFDSIVSWYGANRPEFRDRIRDLELPFTFFPALPGEDSAVHAADFYLAQVRSIARCASDGIPRIRCEATSEDFAVIHPFSGSPKKNWPLSRFRELAGQLERSLPVRWCAGPEDPRIEGAVRIDNLYELACWLAKARLYVGNDSGITHLAAAVGTPVIVLFGPTDPEVWGPRGPNVRVGRWGNSSEPAGSARPASTVRPKS
jgi:heptosyltransferase-3